MNIISNKEALLLFLFGFYSVFLTGQIPFFDGKYWGLINVEDFVIQSPIYESKPEILTRVDGKLVYKVWLGSEYVITSLNEQPLLKGYNQYEKLRGNIIKISKGGKSGLYDVSIGEVVLEPTYDKLEVSFSLDDNFIIAKKTFSQGVIDRLGKVIVPLSNYRNIMSIESNGKKYIVCIGESENDVEIFNTSGEKQEVVLKLPSRFFSIPIEPDKKNFRLHQIPDGVIKILDSYSQLIYSTKVNSNINIVKLLYNLPDYDMNRCYFIVVYKENDLYGLYDLLFNKKITEAIYSEVITEHLGDPLVRINDKYGVVHFTYEEDEDYEVEHIIANPSSIIFQKIDHYKNLSPFNNIFTLPNGYRCFGKFNTQTSKYNYFLPKEIKDIYNLL